MPKSTTVCNALLLLIFNATTWNNIAENDTTTPATVLDVALHTADPGIGGAQTTNEIAYTNYARVSVNRNSGGWTVASNAVENAALIQFPQCGASGGTATHVSIGVGGVVLYAGALDDPLTIANKIQPQFAAGDLVAQET